MTQPATTSPTDTGHDVFHPDGMAVLAALAGGRDERPAWHDDALCAQTDPEAFFPEKGGSTREAKEICGRCPVRSECLADALASDTRFGVWGGLSERERRVLRLDPHAGDPTPEAETAEGAEDALVAEPAVPEPREKQRGRPRRESTPAPGRTAGPGVAATLPSEPRSHRPHTDRPARPTSTFPTRARTAAPVPDPAAEPHTRRPAARSTSRRASTTRSTRPASSRPASAEQQQPAPSAPERQAEAATVITATTGTGEDRAIGAETVPAEDSAAAGGAVAVPPVPDPPPEDPTDLADPVRSELGDAARIVLEGQNGYPGAGGVDHSAVLTLACAITAGTASGAAPDAGLWEWRAAAVTVVISGIVTRGRAGRAMGEPTQDVAHWVRLHLEGMALVEPDEQDRAGVR